MNDNSEKYKLVFKKIMSVSELEIDELKFKESPQWDSMSQIALISGLEEAFNINFDFEDIFNLNSYQKGIEILQTKYGVKF